MKAKLITIHGEPKQAEVSGKPIYRMKADIALDGKTLENVGVTAWGDKALEQFKAGAELDAKSREHPEYGTSYTVFAERPAGGGGGMRGRSPEEQRQIVAQSSLKVAQEWIAHDPREGEEHAKLYTKENLVKLAEYIADWAIAYSKKA
jgi:hypothetical protein